MDELRAAISQEKGPEEYATSGGQGRSGILPLLSAKMALLLFFPKVSEANPGEHFSTRIKWRSVPCEPQSRVLELVNLLPTPRPHHNGEQQQTMNTQWCCLSRVFLNEEGIIVTQA
jgi:hypothetical protein